MVEGLDLNLAEMGDGDYTVHWYDPHTAQWLDTAVVTAQNNTLTIPIPPFRDDLAAKITRSP